MGAENENSAEPLETVELGVNHMEFKQPMPILAGQDHRELFDGYKIDKEGTIFGKRGHALKPRANGKYNITKDGKTVRLSIAEVEAMRNNLFSN